MTSLALSILLVSSCVAAFLTGLGPDLLTQPLVAYFEQAGLPRSASAVSTAIVPVMRFISTLIAGQLSSPAFHSRRLRTAVLVFAALGVLGFILPLALPKSATAWIVGSACIGMGEQLPYLQVVLVRDDLRIPEQTRRRSSSLVWAFFMFGTACAFPCSGVLTARYSMKAVLWFGIACQSALTLALCVVMTAESSLQRTHGLRTDSTSEHGLPCGGEGGEGAEGDEGAQGGKGTEGGESKGCDLKLRIHACFAATFFLMGHMRGVVTVGSSFFYANEFGVSDQFGGWLSFGAFTLGMAIALLVRSCYVQVPLDAFGALFLSVPGTILYVSSSLYTIVIGETMCIVSYVCGVGTMCTFLQAYVPNASRGRYLMYMNAIRQIGMTLGFFINTIVIDQPVPRFAYCACSASLQTLGVLSLIATFSCRILTLPAALFAGAPDATYARLREFRRMRSDIFELEVRASALVRDHKAEQQ